MYRIEPATLEDFKAMQDNATESCYTDIKSLTGAVLSKLICNDEVIALAAYKDFDLGSGEEWRAISCLFRKDIKLHTKTIVEAGRHYLNIVHDRPLMAFAVDNNKTFKRFLSFMGFSDTKELEILPETGTVYRVYVRK